MLIKTREFKVTAAALMFDSQLYLFDFAPKQQLSRFLLVDEDALKLSPFIDMFFILRDLGRRAVKEWIEALAK
jgi:hypothetical protein